jgi:two-component system sensor histidine kinase KdpD
VRTEGDGTAADMDVEAVIRRRPTVVLVDDVAHRNAAGARNPSRWQDID